MAYPKFKSPATEEFTLESNSAHQPFHAKTIETCYQLLQTHLNGLTPEALADRLARFGPNLLPGPSYPTSHKLCLDQMRSMATVLLSLAAIVSFWSQQPHAAWTIVGALILNFNIRFWTQWKTMKGLHGQAATSATQCKVRRNGMVERITATDLVPGDILLVQHGQHVPADARLIESSDLKVDESMLTGESVLMVKDANALHIPDEDITDQSNMIFAGTLIKTGKGEAIITATGSHTVMGQIAIMAADNKKRKPPFTRQLQRLGLGFFGVILLATMAIMAIEVHRGTPLLGLLPIAFTLLVTAVPEILPMLSSFTLALGMERLGKKHIVIKTLHAMETMGQTTVLCTDKTGTLTENAFTVHQIFMPKLGILPYNPRWQDGEDIPNEAVEAFLRHARLNNATILDGIRNFMMGDPIDIALHRSAPATLELGYHHLHALPFDPETMRSGTIVKGPEGEMECYIKGAPESILAICTHYIEPDGRVSLMSPTQRAEFLLSNQDLSLDQARRVIGFAQKLVTPDDTDPFEHAVFIGWVCLSDPPKPGVVEAVAHCKEAGVRLMMITGDQKATAALTAKELGILFYNGTVWTRKDLESGTANIPKNVCVFARTKPEEKMAIVKSLQRSGEIVAMVGDGVNDAPALQRSDVAIAMGLHGADAAKEAADIILLKDAFQGIADTVTESRRLLANIQLMMDYMLTSNLGLVLFLAFTSITGFGLPIPPAQLLWLNMVMITLQTLSLAFQSNTNAQYKRHMKQPQLFSREHKALLVLWSVLVVITGISVFLVSHLLLKQPLAVAGTASFAALGYLSAIHLLNIQYTHSGLSLGEFCQKHLSSPLTLGILGGFVGLHTLALALPPVQAALGISALPPITWLLAAGLGAVIIFASMALVDMDHGEPADDKQPDIYLPPFKS